MKRVLFYLLFSIVVAVILAVFTCIIVPEPVLTTLYTVAGVIFSVGMSLTIAPKTERVTNTQARKDIRNSYLRVRNSFMFLFGFDTVLFVAAELLENSKVAITTKIAFAIFVVISVIYYIFNFIQLQQLGDEVEDQILKETTAAEKDVESKSSE